MALGHPQLFLGHQGCPQGPPGMSPEVPGPPTLSPRPLEAQDSPQGPWATQDVSLSSDGPCSPLLEDPSTSLGHQDVPNWSQGPHEALALVPRGPSGMSPHLHKALDTTEQPQVPPGGPGPSQVSPRDPSSIRGVPLETWTPQKVQPGGPQRSQVHLRGPRFSQEFPQTHPGALGSIQGLPGPSRGCRVHPGGPGSIQDVPTKAWSVHKVHPGDPQPSQIHPGAPETPEVHPGAPVSPCGRPHRVRGSQPGLFGHLGAAPGSLCPCPHSWGSVATSEPLLGRRVRVSRAGAPWAPWSRSRVTPLQPVGRPRPWLGAGAPGLCRSRSGRPWLRA